MLATKNRVDPGGDSVQAWFNRVLSIPTLHVLPVTPQLPLESTTPPDEFHGDPAGRITVATARSQNLTLITEDRNILAYPHVRTVGPS